MNIDKYYATILLMKETKQRQKDIRIFLPLHVYKTKSV